MKGALIRTKLIYTQKSVSKNCRRVLMWSWHIFIWEAGLSVVAYLVQSESSTFVRAKGVVRVFFFEYSNVPKGVKSLVCGCTLGVCATCCAELCHKGVTLVLMCRSKKGVFERISLFGFHTSPVARMRRYKNKAGCSAEVERKKRIPAKMGPGQHWF